jgi:Protein of unknown function (DUF2806)
MKITPMAEGPPFINLGELSKPATVLIEKVSEAIGGIFAPRQIRRIAQANADAALIATEADIKRTELQKRALQRFVNEEVKKQENIESITAKALPLLEDKSEPQKMEDDWISNFFDKCRIVSDNEMQTLWSKVLAGEANAPGAFSKRTVNTLGSLDKSDAILFEKLCTFVWDVGDAMPLIFDFNQSMYTNIGVNFVSLTHLDSIGLLRFESTSGFVIEQLPKFVSASYFGTSIRVEFSGEKNNSLDVGNVLLSQVGMQLARICTAKASEAFLEYVIDHWAKRYLFPSSVYPRTRAKARISNGENAP